MENMVIQPRINFKNQLFMKKEILKSVVKYALIAVITTACNSSDAKDFSEDYSFNN